MENKSNIAVIILIKTSLAAGLAAFSFFIFSMLNIVFYLLFGCVSLIISCVINTKYITSIILSVPVCYGVAIFISHLLSTNQQSGLKQVLFASFISFGNYFVPMVITVIISGVILILRNLVMRHKLRRQKEDE
jgi:hypothetical protein